MFSTPTREEANQIKALLSSEAANNHELGLYLLEGLGLLPSKIIELLLEYRKQYYNPFPLSITYKKQAIQLSIRIIGRVLKRLPPEIGQVQNLVELELTDVYLEELPKELKELKQLRKLDIKQNYGLEIEHLQPIFELKKLSILNLGSCHLKSFPQELVSMENIEVLYLNKNNISCIPKEIKQLKQLAYLELKNNDITKVPSELFTLEELGYLNLENNPLLEPQKRILRTYKKRNGIVY